MPENEQNIRKRTLLHYGVLLLLFFVLFFGGLYYARQFLVPLSVALLLAMVVMPLVNKVEKVSGKRWLGAFTGSFTVLLFFLLIFSVVVFQIDEIAENWDQLKNTATDKLQQLEQWLTSKTPLSSERLDKVLAGIRENSMSKIKSFVTVLQTTLTDMLLILIYIYLMIYYRHKFRNFIKEIAPDDLEHNPDELIDDTVDVAKGYLAGKAIIIIVLAALYIAGLSIIGLRYSVLIGIIAAFLSIIPYFGNVIGGALALFFALVTKDSFSALIGVLIVFSIVQFLESYIITPMIIQKNIQLNPFFTILSVILGGVIWGVPGMIIGIPYLAIIQLVMDNVKRTEPLARLLQVEDKDDEGLVEKVKKKL